MRGGPAELVHIAAMVSRWRNAPSSSALSKRARSRTVEIARACSLEKLEAEFIGTQEGALKVFSLLGFGELTRLSSYVKDMQAIPHDYILMGLNLKTDEEYAGVGG